MENFVFYGVLVSKSNGKRLKKIQKSTSAGIKYIYIFWGLRLKTKYIFFVKKIPWPISFISPPATVFIIFWNFLTLPVPIPDEKKKRSTTKKCENKNLTKFFISIQLSEMHGSLTVNISSNETVLHCQ